MHISVGACIRSSKESRLYASRRIKHTSEMMTHILCLCHHPPEPSVCGIVLLFPVPFINLLSHWTSSFLPSHRFTAQVPACSHVLHTSSLLHLFPAPALQHISISSSATAPWSRHPPALMCCNSSAVHLILSSSWFCLAPLSLLPVTGAFMLCDSALSQAPVLNSSHWTVYIPSATFTNQSGDSCGDLQTHCCHGTHPPEPAPSCSGAGSHDIWSCVVCSISYLSLFSSLSSSNVTPRVSFNMHRTSVTKLTRCTFALPEQVYVNWFHLPINE